MTLVFLASPYSHEDSSIREARFREACEASIWLISAGYIVYSPVLHWHPAAALYNLPKDAEFYKENSYAFLEVCDRVLFLQINGWRTSRGMQEELRVAQVIKIPFRYIHRTTGLQKYIINDEPEV